MQSTLFGNWRVRAEAGFKLLLLFGSSLIHFGNLQELWTSIILKSDNSQAVRMSVECTLPCMPPTSSTRYSTSPCDDYAGHSSISRAGSDQ